MNNKLTQEELEKDLKLDSKALQELDDATQEISIMAVMENIERLRQARLDASPDPSEYTQKSMARKAGISLSTYKDYLTGTSDALTVKAVFNIKHALQCSLDDIMEPG